MLSVKRFVYIFATRFEIQTNPFIGCRCHQGLLVITQEGTLELLHLFQSPSFRCSLSLTSLRKDHIIHYVHINCSMPPAYEATTPLNTHSFSLTLYSCVKEKLISVSHNLVLMRYSMKRIDGFAELIRKTTLQCPAWRISSYLAHRPPLIDRLSSNSPRIQEHSLTRERPWRR